LEDAAFDWQIENRELSDEYDVFSFISKIDDDVTKTLSELISTNSQIVLPDWIAPAKLEKITAVGCMRICEQLSSQGLANPGDTGTNKPLFAQSETPCFYFKFRKSAGQFEEDQQLGQCTEFFTGRLYSDEHGGILEQIKDAAAFEDKSRSTADLNEEASEQIFYRKRERSASSNQKLRVQPISAHFAAKELNRQAGRLNYVHDPEAMDTVQNFKRPSLLSAFPSDFFTNDLGPSKVEDYAPCELHYLRRMLFWCRRVERFDRSIFADPHSFHQKASTVLARKETGRGCTRTGPLASFSSYAIDRMCYPTDPTSNSKIGREMREDMRGLPIYGDEEDMEEGQPDAGGLPSPERLGQMRNLYERAEFVRIILETHRKHPEWLLIPKRRLVFFHLFSVSQLGATLQAVADEHEQSTTLLVSKTGKKNATKESVEYLEGSLASLSPLADLLANFFEELLNSQNGLYFNPGKLSTDSVNQVRSPDWYKEETDQQRKQAAQQVLLNTLQRLHARCLFFETSHGASSVPPFGKSRSAARKVEHDDFCSFAPEGRVL